MAADTGRHANIFVARTINFCTEREQFFVVFRTGERHGVAGKVSSDIGEVGVAQLIQLPSHFWHFALAAFYIVQLLQQIFFTLSSKFWKSGHHAVAVGAVTSATGFCECFACCGVARHDRRCCDQTENKNTFSNQRFHTFTTSRTLSWQIKKRRHYILRPRRTEKRPF